MFPWWLILIPIVVLLIVLEGRRQARRLGKHDRQRGTGGNALGAGMLEFQQLLQPDRDVKTIRLDLTDEDRVHPEYRLDEEGDDDDRR